MEKEKQKVEEKSTSTTIKKKNTAEIRTKSGGSYSYTYVSIAQIHEYLESINAKYIQKVERIDNDDYIFTKRCFDDKWEDDWLQGCRVVQATLMGNNNPAQEQGSALTYARRYSLLMAFGLATEDDDANSLNNYNREPQAPRLITDKQKEMILRFYQGDNLMKLLQANSIQRIEDLPMNKGSQLIGEILKRQQVSREPQDVTLPNK